jgi:hypothetical protein
MKADMRAENRVHMVCRSYDGATITTSFAAFRWSGGGGAVRLSSRRLVLEPESSLSPM